MNLVADEGIDRSIVSHLRAQGIKVWYIADIAPASSDSDVFKLANDNDAILLTADKDFGAIVFQQRRITSGVVLIRLHGIESKQKAELVVDLFQRYGERLRQAFTVLTPDRVRIRPRPPLD